MLLMDFFNDVQLYVIAGLTYPYKSKNSESAEESSEEQGIK